MRYARENPDLSYEELQDRLAQHADWQRWVRKEDYAADELRVSAQLTSEEQAELFKHAENTDGQV